MGSKTHGKAARLAAANLVLCAIASTGRRLFYCDHTKNTARFEIGNQGQILLLDDQTGWPVYIASKGEWAGFSHGELPREIVEALRNHIRSGDPLPAGLFDARAAQRWEYTPDEMDTVRAKLATIPGLQPPAHRI